MNIFSTINSFCEFVNGVEKAPKFAHLMDVLTKIDTPFQYCITEREVNEAIDSVKDLIHSQITQSYYKDERQRELDKNTITANAEQLKNSIKEHLSVRNLLVENK